MTQDASPQLARPKPRLRIEPARGWAALDFMQVWQFRDLLFSLAGRDVKLRYKQTALGVIWVILQPLMAAGAFTLVFGKLAKFPSDGKPYFLFSYAGLLGWNLFSTTLVKTSGVLLGNSQLISKIYFPRLVLPLSTVPSALLDFGIALALMAVLLPIYGVAPGWAVLTLPVWMACLLMMSVGLGLVIAALTVSYRDVQYILPVFVQILLYASPVAFSLAYALAELPSAWRPLILLNPLAGPLEAFRWSLLDTAAPSVGSLAYALVVSVAVFLIGAFSFKRMERRFADVI